MTIDGKRIAEDVYARLPGKNATLGILVGEQSPVINSFVRIKERAAKRLGVKLERYVLPAGAGTADAVQAVEELALHSDGVIVQLPLPARVDTELVLAAIPPQKDVDGISKRPLVRPPVAGAVAEILNEVHVTPTGKSACVVGSGRLVGKPVAEMLREMGADVTVLQKGDSLAPLKQADIVVLGAGEPGIVQPNHLKKGVVLIDAGTSEAGGKVAGDADPACASKASVFTPVPGGVGPVAVAMIFRNLFDLIENKN